MATQLIMDVPLDKYSAKLMYLTRNDNLAIVFDSKHLLLWPKLNLPRRRYRNTASSDNANISI